MLRKGDNGKYILGLPVASDAQMPLIDIEKDTGKFVKAILMNREEALGKEYLGATDYYTPQQVVDEFTKQFPEDGKGASFFEVPDDMYKGILGSMGMPPKIQEELLQNMKLLGKEYGYYAGADLKPSQKVSNGKRESELIGRSLPTLSPLRPTTSKVFRRSRA